MGTIKEDPQERVQGTGASDPAGNYRGSVCGADPGTNCGAGCFAVCAPLIFLVVCASRTYQG